MDNKMLYDDELWAELCEDPLYPCRSCRKCNVPQMCHLKRCGAWRKWWKLRYSQIICALEEIKREKEEMSAVYE